jgi:hypothetical protein
MKEILQLYVSLEYSKPSIWRQIQLRKETTFFELHHILQITMGWTNSHLHEFNCDGYRIGEIIEEFNMEGFGSDEVTDSKTVSIKDIIQKIDQPFRYTYDFGDSWDHILHIEKSLPADPKIKYPICVGGGLSCPPEDCGGIHSYYNYLDILKDKKHVEYKELRTWIGRNFDSNKFDNETVNRKLSNLKKFTSK